MERALDTLGWSSQQLARHLGIRETTIRQWQNGRRHVPTNVLNWLEDRAKRLSDAPDLPEGWQRGEG
jgi:ribosome-binding protein aMBF1 (putative translation factor)